MKFELRAQATPVRIEGKTMYGTAVPYNANSHDLGGFVERFAPGSLTRTIQSGMIEAWAHHDQTKPLGSQAGGSLRLKDTDAGLTYELDLPDTTYANDLRALMTRDDGKSDIGGTSFGFYPTEKGQQWTRENGQNIRTITDAEINHISPVVTPAYPQTSASLRSLMAVETDVKETYGIDLHKLANIFVAVNRGLHITEAEMEIAKDAVKQLRAAIITPRLDEARKAAARLLL